MKKQNQLWQIWDILPKRFQGMIMMLLLIIIFNIIAELITIIRTDYIIINIIIFLTYMFILTYVCLRISPWLAK